VAFKNFLVTNRCCTWGWRDGYASDVATWCSFV